MQAPYPVLYQVKIECKAFTLRIGLVTVPVHVYSGTLFMSDEIDEWIRNDGVMIDTIPEIKLLHTFKLLPDILPDERKIGAVYRKNNCTLFL